MASNFDEIAKEFGGEMATEQAGIDSSQDFSSIAKEFGGEEVVAEESSPEMDVEETKSKNIFERLHSFSDKARESQKNFLIGQAKGLGSTVMGIGEIGIKTVGKLVPGLDTERASIKAEETRKDLTTPEGTAQKIGFGVEQVGELLTPVEIEGKIASLAGKSGKAKAALGAGVEAAKTGAVSAGQSGSLEQGVEVAGETAGIIAGTSSLGKVLTKTMPYVASALEKINLRLTPVQKRDIGAKLDRSVAYIKSKIPAGTPQKRLEKAEELVEMTEGKFQEFLKKGAKDKTVSREQLKAEIESLKQKYTTDRDAIAIESQLDGFNKLLSSKFGDDIPVSALNELKRSTYKNAYNKAGEKVVDYVEHDIGDVLRKNIESATEGVTFKTGKTSVSLSDFNKEYGDLLESRKLLKIAASRPEMGLVGKIISSGVGSMVGSAVGGPIGGAVGLAVGQGIGQGVAGTAVRSLLAKTLEKAAGLPGKEGVDLIWKAVLPYLNK